MLNSFCAGSALEMADRKDVRGDAAREPALDAGATAFYVKGSLDPEQLIAQMAVLMDRHRAAACG